jgi:hypothetical protein
MLLGMSEQGSLMTGVCNIITLLFVKLLLYILVQFFLSHATVFPEDWIWI